MKRRWKSLLLVALLFALLAMTAALAETNDEIELVINDEELNLFSEPVNLDIPEELELLLGESENERIEDISLYPSQGSIESTIISVEDLALSNDVIEDYGIRRTYSNSTGDTTGRLFTISGPGYETMNGEKILRAGSSVDITWHSAYSNTRSVRFTVTLNGNDQKALRQVLINCG